MEPSRKPDRRAMTLMAFAILTTAILVGSVAFYYFHRETPLSISSNETNTSVYNPNSGLQLILNLGNVTIHSGQNETINFQLYNAFDTMNTVNVERNYPIFASANQISAGPCSDIPYGIAVLSGNYSVDSLRSATPLQIFEPGVYFCPAEFMVSQYQFYPHSSRAKLYSNESGFLQGVSADFNESVNLSGYWNGNYKAHTFETFSPGIYTVVAADGWGQVLALHFLVEA